MNDRKDRCSFMMIMDLRLWFYVSPGYLVAATAIHVELCALLRCRYTSCLSGVGNPERSKINWNNLRYVTAVRRLEDDGGEEVLMYIRYTDGQKGQK
jgi:hypothetical protein